MKPIRFDFLSISPVVTTASLALAVFALFWIIANGLNYGIDFAGGNEVQIRFSSPPSASELREYVNKKGFTKSSVQSFGDSKKEFLIWTENKGEENSALENLIQSMKEDFKEKEVEIRKIDSVGPQIGSELRKKGLLAVVYSLIMILIYLALRFDYKFAPAAVICLFHDAILTMWIFSLFNLVVNVQTLAALLAIIGYSLNDTIVTFDRIRENKEYFGKKQSFFKICNQSINDVLSRTLLTSITTMMSVGVMWFFTDGAIKDFAFTLGVGVLIGTFSSIYIATPLVIFISRFSKRKN